MKPKVKSHIFNQETLTSLKAVKLQLITCDKQFDIDDRLRLVDSMFHLIRFTDS